MPGIFDDHIRFVPAAGAFLGNAWNEVAEDPNRPIVGSHPVGDVADIEDLPIGDTEQFCGRLMLTTRAEKAARFLLYHLHDEVGAQRALRLGWPGTRHTEHRSLPAKSKNLLMNVVEVRVGSGERIADPDDLTVHALVRELA